MKQTNKSRIDKREYSYNLDISYNVRNWYKNGKLHRERDLPATIHNNGSMFYLKDNQFHRDNNKPAIIHNDGRLSWYENGRLMNTNCF